MGELSIMDDTGDTKLIWSANNQDEVDAAKEMFKNPICSVTYAPGNRQHNSRSAQLGFFKFPDK